MQGVNDEAAVRRLLAKFANSIDLKAWAELGECVADSIYTDFSDLRGSPPEALARLDFVAGNKLTGTLTRPNVSVPDQNGLAPAFSSSGSARLLRAVLGSALLLSS